MRTIIIWNPTDARSRFESPCDQATFVKPEFKSNAILEHAAGHLDIGVTDTDITDRQHFNALSLIGKSWSHFGTIGGFETSRIPYSAWRLFTRNSRNAQTVFSSGDYERWVRSFNSNFTSRGVGSYAIRIPNYTSAKKTSILSLIHRLDAVLYWAVKYTDRCRLSSATALTWETFEKITKLREPGIGMRSEAEVEREDETADETQVGAAPAVFNHPPPAAPVRFTLPVTETASEEEQGDSAYGPSEVV